MTCIFSPLGTKLKKIGLFACQILEDFTFLEEHLNDSFSPCAIVTLIKDIAFFSSLGTKLKNNMTIWMSNSGRYFLQIEKLDDLFAHITYHL